jgi:outer membrane immunogenic protein
MRKLLLSASALCALAATAGTASAADLARPVYRAPAVVPVCTTCNWSGFYIGFNLGESKDWTSTTETWAWNQVFSPNAALGIQVPTPVITANTSALQSTYRHASMGFIGGAQWGYNWQFGGVVLGLEGDWNWSNEKDTYSTGGTQPLATSAIISVLGTPTVVATGLSNPGWTSEEKIDWLTTWRARLGWAHDCYMWYLTGGVAWAKVENNYLLTSTPGQAGGVFPAVLGPTGVIGLPGGAAAGNFSTTKTGWVLGGGVETSIGQLFGWGNNNWSMKLEYLYVDLGSVNNTIGTTLVPVNVLGAVGGLAVNAVGTGTTSFNSQNHIYEQIIRVGINYRFNYASYAPAVLTK